MKQGDTFEVKRTFTKADVETFAEFSGDRNAHHIIPDEQGRLVVHGLLTATLPSVIGGRLNINARMFQAEFLKPVYTGDEITCNITVEKLEPKNGRIKVTALFTAANQHGVQVMIGYFFGLTAESNQN